MKSAPPHSFGRVTYALAALVFAGFALASLQGASCSGNPSINVNQTVCVSADGSGQCTAGAGAQSSGGAGDDGSDDSPGSGGFVDPFGTNTPCADQYDCVTDEPLDQCLAAACVKGRCVTVVNSFQECTPYSLTCVVGKCMPAPSTSLYPAFCSFSTNLAPYAPQVLPGTCLINGECLQAGQSPTGQPCKVCVPGSYGPGTAEPKTCDAGKFCSATGACVECETEATCTNTPSSACMKRACIAGVCGEEPDLGKVCNDPTGPECVVARCIPGTEPDSAVCESNVVALNTYFTSSGHAPLAGNENILAAGQCLIGATSGVDGTCIAENVGRKPGNDCYFCSPGASPPTYAANALDGAAFNWTAQNTATPCDVGPGPASGTCVAGTPPETDAVVCQANP